jgi:hypothetical protein
MFNLNKKWKNKGFSFEAITPTNDDFIETVTTTNPSLLDADDRLPLTVEVEPGFKQISTTFMIVFQILIIVTFFFVLKFEIIYYDKNF